MISQSVKMAWFSITANKMRSLLTMLGMIIGVASLVVLVSLVNGATGSVTNSISSMGTDFLTVSIRDNKGKALKTEDLIPFFEEESVGAVAPFSQVNLPVANSYVNETAGVYGVTPSYQIALGLELSSGRFIKSTDVENHTKVAVISSDIATEIIGRTDVINETIKVNGVTYIIIGVIKAQEGRSESNSVYNLYVPFTSLPRLSESVSSEVTAFYVTASEEASPEAAENAISDLLLKRFNEDSSAFNITNQSAILEAMQSVTDTMSLLLGGIAAISLIVGGIGIMNIMLVSVTERTREIGIRKAVGAGKMSILLQFLIEALMISLLGCVIGILLSFGILQIVNLVGGTLYRLSSGVTWISVLFSSFVGMIFGMYPANKAAKKKPIEALRFSS